MCCCNNLLYYYTQFEYPASPVALRILKLKYDHVVQNITYGCAAGVDGFLKLKLETANGDTIEYADRGISVMSNVSTVPSAMHKSLL